MNVNRARSLAPILILAVFAALLLFNVQVLTAATPKIAAPEYGLVLIANDVYHCTSGGIGGCSPQSSHVWVPKKAEPAPSVPVNQVSK